MAKGVSATGLRIALSAVVVVSTVTHAEPDPTLEALIAEALANRPELSQAAAELRAAEERLPQAQAWPDPMLQVGVQNDGFTAWRVGTMETSWVSFMATQTIPFPGKPSLRGAVAEVDVSLRQFGLERVRLSTIAEVRRAALTLQLTRARLELLGRLTALVGQAVEVARTRYETNDAPQSDVSRAGLELGRLEQRRVLLRADEQLQVEALNRLRGRPLDEPVATTPLRELGFPATPRAEEATEQLLAVSPEYRAARVAVGGAEQRRALAQRQYFPDLTVGAGLMVRGALDPMWSVTLGVPLPIFADSKQARAVAEADATIEASHHGAAALEQLVRLRTAQRLAVWRALSQAWTSYEGQLHADAEATASATLGQYRVGKVPFAAVLEASTAAISVRDAANEVLAEAWRLEIAQAEGSLAEAGASGPAGGGMR